MNIPNVPKEPLLHEDGKNVHPVWANFFDFLINQLQGNLGNEGIVTPGQETVNINLLTNSQPFTILGDKTSNELKVYLNGAWKTITTS